MTSSKWKEIVDIRPATKEDIPSVLRLIQLFAEHEKEPNALKIGVKEFLHGGFGPKKYFDILVAELKTAPTANNVVPASPDLLSSKMAINERIIGYAVYFFSFSTWAGRVLYAEDLFVCEGYRDMGLGTALLRECAKVAQASDCARMVWQVLDWNTKALELYERIGGKCIKELLTIRMEKTEIAYFASSDSSQLHQHGTLLSKI